MIASQRQSGGLAGFRIVVVGEAAVFLLAALLHTGAFGVPALIPAMIVEGICGIGCVFSAYALFTHKPWSYKAAMSVQIFILLGVLLGISALASSSGLRTPLNLGLHGVMLVLILAGLTLLLIPGTRQAFPTSHKG